MIQQRLPVAVVVRSALLPRPLLSIQRSYAFAATSVVGSTGASTLSSSRSSKETSNINIGNDISEPPFYGNPRQNTFSPSSSSSSLYTPGLTWSERMAIALHSATTALADPTRADAIAALGDVTAPLTLRRIHHQMQQHETGRLILQERPIVSKATIPYETLIKGAPDRIEDAKTFGQAYGCFLKSHGFDPDEREDVRCIPDETLAYIMKRYRQCHDFWHALTGLPPTILGELGIKWLELFATGLPVAALSCTVGSMRLTPKEREILMTLYLPWAVRANQNNPPCFLMNVYYEKEFDTPLEKLRQRLNLAPAPNVET